LHYEQHKVGVKKQDKYIRLYNEMQERKSEVEFWANACLEIAISPEGSGRNSQEGGIRYLAKNGGGGWLESKIFKSETCMGCYPSLE
jgi:hypothetical protein